MPSPNWPGANEHPKQWQVYQHLKGREKPDKDGWIVYEPKVRDEIAESLGFTSQIVASTLSNMSRSGYLRLLKENNRILGVKLEKEPPSTLAEVIKANIGGRRAAQKRNGDNHGATSDHDATTSSDRGAATSEFLPENYTAPNFANVPTKNLQEYLAAKQWKEQIKESPYLQVNFVRNEFAEEALEILSQLQKAQTMLNERTSMLNRSNRERNYLVKARNPQLRQALQAAGVMVAHGD